MRVLLGEQSTSKETLMHENGSPLEANLPFEGIDDDDEDDDDDDDEEGEGSSANRQLPGLQNRLSQGSHHANITSPSHPLTLSLQPPPPPSSSGSPLSSHPFDTTTTTFVREISPGGWYSLVT